MKNPCCEIALDDNHINDAMRYANVGYSLKIAAKQWQEYKACQRYYELDYGMSEMRIMAQNYAGNGGSGGMAQQDNSAKVFKREYISKLSNRSLGDQLAELINRSEQHLNELRASKEIISDLEKKFNRGDVVFHKNTGPAILQGFSFYDGISRGLPESYDGPPLKGGEILAEVSCVNGHTTLAAKDLVPYTESVKLLYEAERNTTNE